MKKSTQSREETGYDGSQVFIRACDLGLNTPRRHAYEGVDLNLCTGKAYAFCGEDRCGRTELLLTLAGRMRPNAGTLTVGDISARSFRGIAAIRRMAGLAFFENVNEVQSALRLITVTSAELDLAGRPSHASDAVDYLVRWDLADLARLHVGDLARYDYDRLGFALGMCADPRILVVNDIEYDLTNHQSIGLVEVLSRLAHERDIVVICGVGDYDLAARFDETVCLTEEALSQRRVSLSTHSNSNNRAA